VLQYEHCKAQPREMIAATYRFLGLDDSFVPEGIDTPVNVQRQVTDALEEETRALLREIYVDDVARLKKMFPREIDLQLWRGFEDPSAA